MTDSFPKVRVSEPVCHDDWSNTMALYSLDEPEAPQPLFEAHLAQGANDAIFEYDVTADGKRFLLDTVEGGSASTLLLNVVLNLAS